LLGTRQTGLAQMRVADLARDVDLLPRVHRSAERLLSDYPERIPPLLARWTARGERFGKV
jgi:ATP-dependent DNA helicase RecG